MWNTSEQAKERYTRQEQPIYFKAAFWRFAFVLDFFVCLCVPCLREQARNPESPQGQHSRVRESDARNSRRRFGRYHLLDLTNTILKVQIIIIKKQNRRFSFGKHILAKHRTSDNFFRPTYY